MQKFLPVMRFFILIVILFSLSSCTSVKEMAGDLFPSPTPQPTLTPIPSVGNVGHTTEWGGWAISVENVLRSSLNPIERIPGNYRPDDLDYIGMDVTIQRTVDEIGNVDGEDFTLVDGSGNVYEQIYPFQNWIYYRGNYELDDMGSDRIVIPVPETVQDLRLRFSPFPELSEPIEIALDQVKQPRRIDLRQAIELGLLDPRVEGVSLESIELQFEVSVDMEDSIELSIAPGTMFLAPSPDLQTMVVRQEMVLFVTPKRELSVELDVACANMTLKAPQGGETYTVQIEPPKEELSKLLGLPEFQDSSFRLQQFAIWTITDNPAAGGYVGLGSGGQGSPPSQDELGLIRTWFEQAGIPVENYLGLH